jgi:hypothetical protein
MDDNIPNAGAREVDGNFLVKKEFAPCSDAEIASLAKALFEEQERMLPEGETWEQVTVADRAFWENSALAVIREFRRLRCT